ncbi:hypothetical protein Ancab_027826 [Ancistrocladus abbreviatus]
MGGAIDALLSTEVLLGRKLGHMIVEERLSSLTCLVCNNWWIWELDAEALTSLHTSAFMPFRSSCIEYLDRVGKHHLAKEVLLSYITSGSDVQVFCSLNVLATLLQTKVFIELDESMLDALGILPQRKQHKKLLLTNFFSNLARECPGSELDSNLQKLKYQSVSAAGGGKFSLLLPDLYGVSYSCIDVESSPRLHRFQVLDALVKLFCRSDVSAWTLWDGCWLLRQLLPYTEADFNKQQLKLLTETFDNCCIGLLQEVKGIWPDQLMSILADEWKKCKRQLRLHLLRRELKDLFLPLPKTYVGDVIPSDSSFAAGENMHKLVKVFVLHCQLQMFLHGRALPDQLPIHQPMDMLENTRAKAVGLDNVCPKPGSELKLVDAIPCRIAFERGKERHFSFLALSMGTSGIINFSRFPGKLASKRGCNYLYSFRTNLMLPPRVDDKHPKWLHLQIRPSSLPSANDLKSIASGRSKTKALIDGRWTLAFRDEESCQSALSMTLEEISQQSSEVERRLRPLLEIESLTNFSDSSSRPEAALSITRPSNS